MENNPTSPAISDCTCLIARTLRTIISCYLGCAGVPQMSLSETVIWGEGVGEERKEHWEALGIKILQAMFCTAVLG